MTAIVHFTLPNGSPSEIVLTEKTKDDIINKANEQIKKLNGSNIWYELLPDLTKHTVKDDQ